MPEEWSHDRSWDSGTKTTLVYLYFSSGGSPLIGIVLVTFPLGMVLLGILFYLGKTKATQKSDVRIPDGQVEARKDKVALGPWLCRITQSYGAEICRAHINVRTRVKGPHNPSDTDLIASELGDFSQVGL